MHKYFNDMGIGHELAQDKTLRGFMGTEPVLLFASRHPECYNDVTFALLNEFLAGYGLVLDAWYSNPFIRHTGMFF